jgi:hypothetical protein
MEENSSLNNAQELANFAKLTGYQTQPNTNSTAATTASRETIPLLDADDISDDPYTGKTKTQVWSNPLAKLGVVGSVFAIAVGGIALFIASANHMKPSAEASSTPTPVAMASPDAKPVDEVGDLKTQTALETQANAIQSASKAQPATSNKNLPTTLPSPSSQTPQRTPQYSSPVSPASFFHPSSSSSSASTQPVDPMQAWQTAQQLGSYGQIAYAAVQAPSIEEVSSSHSSPISAADTDYQQQQYQSDEDAIINGTSRQFSRITTGAIATGSLETPLIWAQDLDASQQAQKFAMTLSQPLTGADGSVALPSGSVLILSINGVDQSGLVNLSAVGAIVPKDNTQKLISLPPGALTVEGTNGRPLLAQQYNGVGHQIAHMDRSLALMGGLAGLGQFVTSPSNSTVSQSLTSTISSSTNRKVNAGSIIGSILNGAFSSLQQQVSQRDTQEIQSLQNRPNVWYVPEGQPLQVFVNSSFEVGL